MNIVFSQQISKVKQLSDAISMAISNGEYEEGDLLPSISQLSKKYDVSRDTVFKAFSELKDKNIINSASTKGYFVSKAVVNVFLLLDTCNPFKFELYNELTRYLPLNYKIDLYFHQYNEERFNKMIDGCAGRYNFYLIMNLQNDVYSEMLDKLDHNKTMLLDFGKFEKEKFAYACQGFDTTLYECLVSGIDLLRKYNRIIFVYPNAAEHPDGCLPYFEKFCNDFNFPYSLTEEIEEEKIRPGTVFLIVSHTDLVELVKIMRRKKYINGEDIGIVVFNDEPIFEILDNGITAISADFRMMGKIAAEFIRTRKKIQTYIPTNLIIRGSL